MDVWSLGELFPRNEPSGSVLPYRYRLTHFSTSTPSGSSERRTETLASKSDGPSKVYTYESDMRTVIVSRGYGGGMTQCPHPRQYLRNDTGLFTHLFRRPLVIIIFSLPLFAQCLPSSSWWCAFRPLDRFLPLPPVSYFSQAPSPASSFWARHRHNVA
jgi:hypothetical protein